MSKLVVALLWIGGVILVGLCVALPFGLNGMKKTLNVEIGNPNLESVPDGTYIGAYEAGRFSNTVEVQVVNHRITGIKVVKDQFMASTSPLGGQLFVKVIDTQSLNVRVDAISGATATTHGYLKAIQNALNIAR